MSDYILRIECKSTVCPSSGETWGGVLDNDVVYDDVGVPFIPAKRIKGLLVESAIDVCSALGHVAVDSEKWAPTLLNDLFGLPGSNSVAPIIIDDARIEHYDERRVWLAWARKAAPDIASPMQVLALFTTTRAQTAIAGENRLDFSPGVAKPHSLRIQRVLKRGLIFESKITIKSYAEEDVYKSILVLAAAATRHMGLNRNRGMGDIEMTLFENGVAIRTDDILEKEVRND